MVKQKGRIIAKYLEYCICCLFFITVCVEGFAQSRFTKTSAQLAKLKNLQAAVESNPESIKNHETFLKALLPDDPYLKSQYAVWLKRFPKSSAVPFSIGKHLVSFLYPEGSGYLLKAVELKPGYAEAWYLLGANAEISGNTLSQEYMANAKKAEPENPKYAMSYAYSFKNTDSARFDSLLLAVAFRFPESAEAPLALTFLALNSQNENEKIAFYEQLYKRYSAKPSQSSSFGIESYYHYLLDKNPKKAFDIALNMVLEPKVNHYQWSENLNLARTVRDVRSMMDQNKPALVLEMLRALPASYQNDERYVLVRTEAIEATLDSKAAYDTLSLFYAKQPGTRGRTALLAYAKKLGKDEQQVDIEIQNMRESSAAPATDFSLEQYYKGGRTSLADHKGKIVLLTHWFPACGPCRAEFPHLDSVVKKFDSKDVAYLGINAARNQDAHVLPFMSSTGYSFIPIKEEPSRDKGNLDYDGVPQNYLIDQKGRIIFSNFRIDETNEDMLKMMISELLKHK
ncbi:redoxin domain-containing protein [Daejeonella sp.]|uniref:redoxin domain-containing protein n=1 Tax=Daejeonella sp. TaxID=2805397 RepID=UPI0030C00C3F